MDIVNVCYFVPSTDFSRTSSDCKLDGMFLEALSENFRSGIFSGVFTVW